MTRAGGNGQTPAVLNDPGGDVLLFRASLTSDQFRTHFSCPAVLQGPPVGPGRQRPCHMARAVFMSASTARCAFFWSSCDAEVCP